jgi:hypothetical protein
MLINSQHLSYNWFARTTRTIGKYNSCLPRPTRRTTHRHRSRGLRTRGTQWHHDHDAFAKPPASGRPRPATSPGLAAMANCRVTFRFWMSHKISRRCVLSVFHYTRRGRMATGLASWARPTAVASTSRRCEPLGSDCGLRVTHDRGLGFRKRAKHAFAARNRNKYGRGQGHGHKIQ